MSLVETLEDRPNLPHLPHLNVDDLLGKGFNLLQDGFRVECIIDNTKCIYIFVAVHFGGGFWGVLAVTFFNHDTGIFYKGDGHSFRLFGWNLLGALVITAWSAGLAFVLFFTMMKLGVLRVSEEIEIKGLPFSHILLCS